MGLLGRAARRLLRSLGDVPALDPVSDLQHLLGSQPVRNVLDVGGCFGDYARRFAETWPDARVWTFEPNPESYARLAEEFANHPKIRTVPKGVWNEPGELEFFLNKWPGACSVFDRPHDGPSYHNPRAVHVDRTLVEVMRLDDWAREEGVETVDLLKLDIQGAELRALEGAADLLKRTRCILTEVHYYPNYDGASLLDEVWGHLRTRGFSLYQLYSNWGASDGQLVQGDAVFVSEAVRNERLHSRRDRPFEAVKYHL